MVMSEKEKLNTAYHEAGHAIVGFCVPDHDPVYKVTIIPRGRALASRCIFPKRISTACPSQRWTATFQRCLVAALLRR